MFLFILVLLLLPSVTFPLLIYFYFRVLIQKREEIDRLFRGETLQKYLRTFGRQKEDHLLEHYLDWKGYILPVILNMSLVWIGVLAFLVHSNTISSGSLLFTLLAQCPSTLLVGFWGAYLWGHYDLIRRFSVIDLSATTLYHVWLRMQLGSIIAYLVGMTLKAPFDLIVAFGVGAFPLESLLGFFRSQVRSKLQWTSSSTPSETPNLHVLQGMTSNIIERLNEENIYSTQHLALANPIRLLMRTNFEWTIILDMIDQAILYNYVGDKMNLVRQVGIRCAMEFSDVRWYLEHKDVQYRRQGEIMLQELAKKLEWNPTSVKSLVYTLDEDSQLNFIYDLWDDAFGSDSK
jgi:hypothetical protein